MAQAKTAWVDLRDQSRRVSIVQILERYGALPALSKSGNGGRWSGACPIHGGTNKTPSRVSVSKNCWNCFGACQCGATSSTLWRRRKASPSEMPHSSLTSGFPAMEMHGLLKFPMGRLLVSANAKRSLSPDENLIPEFSKKYAFSKKGVAFNRGIEVNESDERNFARDMKGVIHRKVATPKMGACAKVYALAADQIMADGLPIAFA